MFEENYENPSLQCKKIKKRKPNSQSKSNFPKGVNFPTFLSAVDEDLSNINSLHFTSFILAVARDSHVSPPASAPLQLYPNSQF